MKEEHGKMGKITIYYWFMPNTIFTLFMVIYLHWALRQTDTEAEREELFMKRLLFGIFLLL